jgi:mono/diheme cytochrome c family protein
MRCSIAVSILFIIGMALRLQSQQSSSSSPANATQRLSDAQRQGAYLFKQRCNVCHALDMEGNIRYGPPLSKEIVQGNEDFVRNQIRDGSLRMPGFRYGLQSTQIDSIIEYLKTVEKP